MARITMKDLGGNFATENIRIGDICTAAVVEAVTGVDPEEELAGKEDFIQPDYCSDVLGSRGLYETFTRTQFLGGWRYRGLCERGGRMNMHPEKAKKVFICSPYHSDPEFNTRLARAACAYVFDRGDFPVAPHLFFPQFIEDDGFTRDWGIEAGHEIMKACDEMLVILIEDANLSDGMKRDIDYAVNQLALDPRAMAFTKKEAEDFIKRHLRSEV